MLREIPWSECEPALRILANTDLADWIPADLWPPFVFLDLERCPHTGRIRELALLPAAGLVPVGEPLGLFNPTAAEIDDLFKAHLPKGAWLTGHNLLRFDLPVLSDLGLDITAWQVLDTLELSLVSNPVRYRHALGGNHTAAGDVLRNLEFVRELDTLWLAVEPAELATYVENLGPGTLQSYLSWVRARRAENVKGLPVERLLQVSPPLIAAPENGGTEPEWLGDGDCLKYHPTTTAQRAALLSWAQAQGVKVFSSVESLHALRHHSQRSRDSCLCSELIASGDVRVVRAALESRLGSGGWQSQDLYLLRWYLKGGRHGFELHPAWGWEGYLAEHDTLFSEGPAEATWSDHEQMWQQSEDGRAWVVLDAERALPVTPPGVRCSLPEGHTRELLQEFLDRRILKPVWTDQGGGSLLLLQSDRGDQQFVALQRALATSTREAESRLAMALAGLDVVLSARDRGGVLEVCVRSTEIPNPTVRAGARWLCNCLPGSPGWQTLVRGLGLPSLPQSRPGETLGVADDGSTGTAQGISRSLVACAGRLLQPDWSLAAVLGYGRLYREQLAIALSAVGQVAHHAERYGTRPRTLARTMDQPGAFLAGQSPEPLPEWTAQVLLTRLPFPSRTDPILQLQLATYEGDDEFGEVVLPAMLARLAATVGLLRAKGLVPLLLDRRASEFAYRKQVEQTVGALIPVPRVPVSDRLESVRGRLQAGLEQLGLGSPRALYARIDPTPTLRRLYGPEAEWLAHQRDLVDSILKGEDLLAVLPTGSGKSACFQVPALIYGELNEQLTLVFSPLRALMRDQVRGLRRRGVLGVECYHGDMDPGERSRVLRDLRQGWTIVLYLAPEQLMNSTLVDILMERGVGLVVVDEAHCLSEWGHDFRPEYQKIVKLVQRLASERADRRPQVAAFTATATRPVQRELMQNLGLTALKVVPLRRPNLHPRIEVVADGDDRARMDRLVAFVREHSQAPGLIYVTTVADTELVCRTLRERARGFLEPTAIDYLHSRAPNRQQRERDFLDPIGPTRVLVCTTAFGMGVDKPNIGWIVHYDAPGSVESYAQEIGRAARNPSLQAELLALVSPSDLERRRRMMDLLEEAEVEMVAELLRSNFAGRATFHCDPDVVAKLLGLPKPEKAGAALFALEQAGILSVDHRALPRCHLSPGETFSEYAPGPNGEGLTRLEALVYRIVAEAPRHPHEVACDALAESCPFPTTPKAVELAIRGMVGDHILAQSWVVRVVRAKADPEPILEDWDRCELELARHLDKAFERESGGTLTLGIPRLLEWMGPGGDLERLERILSGWRAARLMFQTRGLTDMRLGRNRGKDFLASIEDDRRLRRDTLQLVQAHWDEQGVADFSKVARRDTFYHGLTMLTARGLLSWEELSDSRNSYRCTFLVQPDEDVARIAALDLAPKRRAAQYRQAELESLFSCSRSESEIWSFVAAYFSRESELTAQAERQMAQILEGLTQQQAGAVRADRRQPLLINAGAGTGKTHVLARRLLTLQAIDMLEPQHILVLSFSRAGAAAIGARVRGLSRALGLHGVRSHTFHSFCFSLYRMFGANRTLIETVTRRSTGSSRNRPGLNKILLDHFGELLGERVQFVDRQATVEAYGGLFDSIRSGHPDLDILILTPEDLLRPGLPDTLQAGDAQASLPLEDVYLAFQAYLAKLEQLQKIDFAGMVSECLQILRTHDYLRGRLQAGIRHLLVDEFQDTSRAQEEVMRLLVGCRGSLTVVGDSDQTIYTFNGSDVRNILEFAKRNRVLWPDRETGVAALEENFRSTPRILEVSNRVIVKNKDRLKKNLRPADCLSDSRRLGYRRTNPLIELVTTENLDCGLGYALHIVTEWIDEGIAPRDIAVLSRLNAPLDRLDTAMRRRRIPVSGYVKVQPQKILEALRRACAIDPTQELIESEALVATEVGRCFSAFHPKLFSLLLQEALDAGLSSLDEWLGMAEAWASDRAESREWTEGVHLKTIHGAKGEEFRRVCVLHLGRGIFPPSRSRDEEEERRLLYVGLTRAEEQLVATGERGHPLFEELRKAAQGQYSDVTWQAPLLEYEEELELDETAPEPIIPASASIPEPEEEPEPEAVEVQIEQTNLMSMFRKWKGDD